MDDWTELVALVRAGDPTAGPLLVNSLAGRLDRYAAFRADDLSQADREDAVERTLAKVVANIDRYDPSKGTLLTWARAILRNELADARRSSKETPADPAELPSGFGGDAFGADPTAHAAVEAVEPSDEAPNAAQVALISVVLQLPRADASLIELHVVERMTFPEIADRLGPPATADNLRKRYSRIRRRVRDDARHDPDLAHYFEENQA